MAETGMAAAPERLQSASSSLKSSKSSKLTSWQSLIATRSSLGGSCLSGAKRIQQSSKVMLRSRGHSAGPGSHEIAGQFLTARVRRRGTGQRSHVRLADAGVAALTSLQSLQTLRLLGGSIFGHGIAVFARFPLQSLTLRSGRLDIKAAFTVNAQFQADQTCKMWLHSRSNTWRMPMFTRVDTGRQRPCTAGSICLA